MMKRAAWVVLVVVCAVVGARAQAPEGWRMRIDRSTSASDPDAPGSVSLVRTATGLHATTPQAAVFWHPSNQASGRYAVKGAFTLVKPSGHTNYYGIVFGGKGLEGGSQAYLYFMVAQDGTFLIKRRVGDAVAEDVHPKTPHAAVKRPDATGTSTNTLEVRVLENTVDYVVNGVTVHTTPRTGVTAATDGLYGVRVNHQLDVRVDGLSMSKS
jgi:hypothetical protein